MIEKVDIAVVGASSQVGETLLDVLQERKFPLGELHLLDEAGANSRMEFAGQPVRLGSIDDFDFSRVHIAFFVSSEKVAAEYVPRAAGTGCIVIDRSPAFRHYDDVPLVIPEINEDDIERFSQRNIIAMPGANAIQAAMALKPLQDSVGIRHINISTYQSVSGAGKQAAEELASQTAALLNFRDVKCRAFDKQVAFNLLPQIGELEANGYSSEELKLIAELQRLLGNTALRINATAVRVPVFIGHAASIQLELEKPLSGGQAKTLWQHVPGLTLMENNNIPTPVTEAAGNDSIFIGRVREDISSENGLNLWLVTDNMRKGAATNAVQIAEILVKLYI